jgi:dipeptidyl aminopeptidase/acylaminoacyl peptidase
MFEHLDPPDTPTPGAAEMQAVMARADTRRRQRRLSAGLGGLAPVVLAGLLYGAVVNRDDTRTVGVTDRPPAGVDAAVTTTTTAASPPSSAPSAPARAGSPARRPAPATVAGAAKPVRVAYLADEGGTTELWSIDPDARSPQRLFRTTRPAGCGTHGISVGPWSPDGNLVPLVRQRSCDHGAPPADVLLIDHTGTLIRTLVGVGGTDVTWAPDGKRLALATDNDVRVIDATSGDVVRTIADVVPTGAPVWGPSRRIAFVGRPSGAPATESPRLYTVDPDTKAAPRELLKGVTGIPSWSPRGTDLVVALDGSTSDPPLAVVPDRAGAAMTRLASGGVGPQWSPDGRCISALVTGSRSGTLDLVTFDAPDATTRCARLLGFAVTMDRTAWAPDSESLYFIKAGDLRNARLDSDVGWYLTSTSATESQPRVGGQ